MKKMPEAQKDAVREMDSAQIMDFQLRLQIQCGMTAEESANYIAQAFEQA